MNAIPAGPIAEPSFIVFSLTGLIVIGLLATLVLLLSNPKTRVATLALLGVFGAISVLLLSLVFLGRTVTQVSQPVPIAPADIKPRPVVASPNATTGRGFVSDKTRPAWVNAPPQLIGDAYQMSIAIGPYTTRAECDAKLPEALQEALGEYVNVCLGDQAVYDVRLPADDLRGQLVKAQWEEIRQLSVGPMIWLHVQLHFDRKIKDRILEAHRQAVIGRRLHVAATWSAIGLALLAVAFGYLKIDLTTGGVYRRRLRLAAVAAILGLVLGLWPLVFGLGLI